MRRYRTLALGAASLVLVLSACTPGGSEGSPGESAAANKPTVKVGSQAFWEAAVVGEMYAQALEAKGYTVDRHLEIGERPEVHAAVEAGDVNLFPEYLGGLSGQGLGIEELSPNPQTAWDSMQQALADKGWVSFDFAPGTDADGFAVRKETADKYDLKTMSDLAAVTDPLVWGVAPGCPDNPVCGPGLKTTYGIDLATLQVENLPPCSTDMATALNDSAIDVAQVCTTQPEIASMNLVLLDDDKHLQPAQNLVPIATTELADAASADFAETLNAITAKLTTEALTQLGFAININHEEIADAASQFLEDNGLL
ncbi:MAG TPA: ABC transporter substrate-binding protein [Candidatus Limnocylindria bacterium]|jgi:osmoprotectant transport system substrate-binding protein|nr:ABC transporter substrate-binding protein [Candidatus Limnocylindria bacterium]